MASAALNVRALQLTTSIAGLGSAAALRGQSLRGHSISSTLAGAGARLESLVVRAEDGNGSARPVGQRHPKKRDEGPNVSGLDSDPRLGSTGKPLLTTGAGHAISNDNDSLTIGQHGYMSMEDFHYLDKNAHFNRERVPERVVHAKGTGAHGYFEVTQPTSDLCCAKFLSEVGKKTPIFARFSTVIGESGSVDTARDPRGFPVKFYTEEGNWDMVGNNTPIFFIRDPNKFPDFIHSQKRDPQTHLRNPDAFWDFLSLVPESVHQVLILFSPRGVPDGFRHMNGYGSHTFKWVNAEGVATWVKFHFKTDQGIKNLSHEQAVQIAGYDPDYATRDLFNTIEEGNFPSWTFYVQTMPIEEAETLDFDPFDLTKVWSQKQYPLREVGKMVLNRNVTNYFNEVEQVAFSPSHMPPGIHPSPDRVLQGRLFAYDDAARYRVGSNFLSLPINSCPFKAQNYQRDGAMSFDDNGGSKPNYYPNSYSDLPQPDPAAGHSESYRMGGGNLVSRKIPEKWLEQDDFKQPAALWNLMSEEDKEETAKNIGNHLGGAKPFIQLRQLDIFRKVSPDLALRIGKWIPVKALQPEPYTMTA